VRRAAVQVSVQDAAGSSSSSTKAAAEATAGTSSSGSAFALDKDVFWFARQSKDRFRWNMLNPLPVLRKVCVSVRLCEMRWLPCTLMNHQAVNLMRCRCFDTHIHHPHHARQQFLLSDFFPEQLNDKIVKPVFAAVVLLLFVAPQVRLRCWLLPWTLCCCVPAPSFMPRVASCPAVPRTQDRDHNFCLSFFWNYCAWPWCLSVWAAVAALLHSVLTHSPGCDPPRVSLLPRVNAACSSGWPLMFVAYPFLGRIWCSFCPFMVYGEVMQRWRTAQGVVLKKWPREERECE
jgi:hypothetical protein